MQLFILVQKIKPHVIKFGKFSIPILNHKNIHHFPPFSYSIGSALQLWGPFHLKSGINVCWDSKNESLLADESMIPGLNTRGLYEAYDIVIILDPSASIANLKDKKKKDKDRLKNIRSSSTTTTLFTTNHLSSFNNNNNSNNSNNNSLDNSLSGQNIYDSTVISCYVLMQASFARLVSSNVSLNNITSKSDTSKNQNNSNKTSARTIKILFQKALMRSGVYAIQELFGMKGSGSSTALAAQDPTCVPITSIAKNTSNPLPDDKNKSANINSLSGNNNINHNINNNNNNVAINLEGNNTDKTKNETSMLSYIESQTNQTTNIINEKTEPNSTKEEKEDDSNECVICLTDPREVAVYPCRHVCLCPTCSEALPSQGNKCPICRREAMLLIRYASLYLPYLLRFNAIVNECFLKSFLYIYI